MSLRAAPLAAALLVLAAGGARAQTGDTVPVPAPRPSRWGTPFAVESTGRATPHRVQGEVVWAGSVRAPRAPADAEPVPEVADTVVPPRRAARDSTARPRTPARDTARAPRRATRADSTARRDTASARATVRRDTAGTRPAAARPRTHRVAQGETLFAIARRYGVTTAQLRALNPDATAGELEAGSVLRLPPAPRPAGSNPTPARPAAAAPERPASASRPPAERPSTATRRRTHTVAAGETLFGLARRYGVTTDAIRRANELPSDQLRAGQTIVIPAQ